MKQSDKITHEFVEFIPAQREENVLYVSIPYATAVHNCFCGCGLKVVTPISPVGWRLTYDGETISLAPSVGNWNFPCRSHYVIDQDTVVWATDMSDEEIEAGRQHDRMAREKYFDTKPQEPASPPPKKKRGFWDWLTRR